MWNSSIRLKKRDKTNYMIICSCIHDPRINTKGSFVHKFSRNYGVLEITYSGCGLRAWRLIESNIIFHGNGIGLSTIPSNYSKQFLTLLHCKWKWLLSGNSNRLLSTIKRGNLISPWLGLVARRVAMEFVSLLHGVTTQSTVAASGLFLSFLEGLGSKIHGLCCKCYGLHKRTIVAALPN